MYIYVNMSKYTGSGILLYEYDTKTDDIMFYLFKNARSCSYNDIGGLKDKKDTSLFVTASREANEESADLIHIEPYILKNNAYVIKLSKYVCFLVKIKKNIIKKKDYLQNLNQMKIDKRKKYWQETNDFIKVSLKKLIKNGIIDNKITHIFYINENKINSRVKVIIKKILSENLINELINTKPIILKKVINNKYVNLLVQ